MQVAKYWRNKKLRYRLIMSVEQKGCERATSEAAPRGRISRVHQPDVKRVKVLP